MDDIAARVKRMIADCLCVGEAEVVESAAFVADLGADSFDAVEILICLEEAFAIEIDDDLLKQVSTVGEAIKQVETLVANRGK